jgi:hypothetical protein
MKHQGISIEIRQLKDMVWLVNGIVVGPADIARDGE